MPTSVGALDLENILYFSDPDLGVQIRYGTPPTSKADAFLYDLGLSDVPNDLHSPQVGEWFQEVCQDIFRAAEQDQYRDLEVLASEYLHIPPDATDPFCLWASFAYFQVPKSRTLAGRRVSNLALRTDCGYINKVRYTYPQNASEEGFAGFLAFIEEWTGFVQQTSVDQIKPLPRGQRKAEPRGLNAVREKFGYPAAEFKILQQSYQFSLTMNGARSNWNDDLDEYARSIGALRESEIALAKSDLQQAILNRIIVRAVSEERERKAGSSGQSPRSKKKSWWKF